MKLYCNYRLVYECEDKDIFEINKASILQSIKTLTNHSILSEKEFIITETKTKAKPNEIRKLLKQYDYYYEVFLELINKHKKITEAKAKEIFCQALMKSNNESELVTNVLNQLKELEISE